jgi:hypothetical protein
MTTINKVAKKWGIPQITIRYNYENGVFPKTKCNIIRRGGITRIFIDEQMMDWFCDKWLKHELPDTIQERHELMHKLY